MTGYPTGDVARLLRISPRRVRALARAGFFQAARDARGEYRFSFQDLILLRAAQSLARARVPSRRIHRALRSLQRQLPADHTLTALAIRADGDQVMVRDGDTVWYPDSGQVTLDFATDGGTAVAPLVHRRTGPGATEPETSEDWFELGLELEEPAPAEAVVAYRECLARQPDHAEAMVNLGRLRQQEGQHREAENLYRHARALRPDMALAAFNLGTLLDQLGRAKEAIDAYHAALAADPELADAHYNLSLLYDHAGDRVAAFRHLRSYRDLTGRRRR